ncbi:MAG TPA: exopolysaccharide biosynthesis protein [Bavariicoccus seileri]|uniref:non-specific protein-tyrosine kinase n=1 Tax=Bavariicoccus seileri TaxID=549685 RepID=A0A3D4S569_9ENTE|nr:CpsD/CapB family tyrosine-protein kinase [Bavariicoccus seileri]HCS93959.1 exopolysaccharide biosynthesis protein [Bavariicoccus seileri]
MELFKFKKNKRKVTKQQIRLDRQQQLGGPLVTLTDSTAVASEQFRTIRTNIQFSVVDKDLKSLGFTSSGPGEGKSTVAANLAVAFAQDGKTVLLVDSDLRKPTVHRTFDLPNKEGLTSLLTDRTKKVPDIIQYLPEANLCVLTSGPKPPNPAELLNSKRMVEVMREFNRAFDMVIYDLPPVIAVTDAQLMAPKLDGVVLVARNDVGSKDGVKKAKDLLELSKGNILGAVFNGAEVRRDGAYGYYYGE